jgi:2-methylisocitrate lyase-like PEP mutase family enzyme
MLDQGRAICEAVSIPVIGDGDTGYGNPANVRRTVVSYARAGFAGVMIEDHAAPKRCGHTRGKEVIGRADALARLRGALDARDEEAGICIVARTDARATLGLDEAMWRMRAFADLGADVVFLEAPRSEAEIAAFCERVSGVRMANMLEEGDTPILPPARLAALGYRIAAYPLTLLNSAVYAMQGALDDLKAGRTPRPRVDFATLRDLVRFASYDEALKRYDAGPVSGPAEPVPVRKRGSGL